MVIELSKSEGSTLAGRRSSRLARRQFFVYKIRLDRSPEQTTGSSDCLCFYCLCFYCLTFSDLPALLCARRASSMATTPDKPEIIWDSRNKTGRSPASTPRHRIRRHHLGRTGRQLAFDIDKCGLPTVPLYGPVTV